MADGPDSTPNEAAPWPDFDAEGYWKFSCASLLPEDAQMIWRARNFPVEAFGDRAPARSAVDVGAGSNLYSALLMLPGRSTSRLPISRAPISTGLQRIWPMRPAGGPGSPSGISWQGCPGMAPLRSRSLSSPRLRSSPRPPATGDRDPPYGQHHSPAAPGPTPRCFGDRIRGWPPGRSV